MVLKPCGDYGAGNGYVDCYQQGGGGGGHHHFYESIKTELESFRLRAVDGDFSAAAATDMMLNDDTSSIVSKKRIDSLFKTTTSVAGDDKKRIPGGGAGRRTKSLMAVDDDHYHHNGGGNYFDYGNYSKDASNKNTVQEKIEKMFAEISSSELDTDVSMDSSTAAVSVGNSNKYHVQYIGCAGLSGKISSLEGLQQPVRDMYFGYRENQHHYQDDYNSEERRDFSGLLEISAAGLTIRYKDDLGNYVHRTDPFQSIAVWAALKYVCRRRSPELQRKKIMAVAAYDISPGYEYAFLPLIADPDSSDKAPLFRDVDAGDRARLDAAGDHAPVFAVVMRKTGKQLECHGFACETENDALLMAANLYGALVEAMSSAAAAGTATAENEAAERKTGPATKRVIRQRNGFTSMSSTAGSSIAGADVAPALPPPRPPRRNKTTSVSSSVSSTGDGMSAIITGDGDVCSDAKTFQMTVRQEPSLRRGVCNSSSSATDVLSSVRKEELKNKKKTESSGGGGDILTKVAIPRSRSFLNSNGLASGKYSRRTAGCGIETAADRRRRRSNGSVMGFSDMFNELRIQEGLNNMDDILNAIINVEGMSYNDLKPIYKEFLTKLSMTLTKDELYQRTKAIMTEQKRKRNNKRRPVPGQSSKVGRSRRLNDKLRDAFNLNAAKSRIGAVLLPSFCKRKKRKPTTSRKQRRCSCSTKSSEISPVGRKTDRKNQRRAASSKRSIAPVLKNRRHVAKASPVCSTSDESDFFAAAALRQRQHQLHQLQQQQQLLFRKSKTRGSKNGSRGTGTASEGGCLHRASSGYFSCSECSAGAADDKCYCGRVGGGSGDSGVRGGECVEPASLVSCSCDSDSCADSDKCYCGRPRRPRNIFDELKSRGFAASESSVSRADSPGTAWKKNELLLLLQQQHDSSCDGGPGGSSSAATATTSIGGGGGGGGKCSGIESSKSLEYLQVTRRHTACSVTKGGQQYSSVSKPSGTTVMDRMKVYAGDSTTTAAGSTSSPSSSLSAATVYSSSSANGSSAHHRRQCRSSSSSSDNFHAIDYKLFANNNGAAAAGRNNKSRGHGAVGSRPNNHYYNNRSGCATKAVDSCHPAAASIAANPFTMNRRSYSSEAVHLSGCRVYHHQTKATATRRHSVHDGYGDVLTSFFKSDIENSLGYYP